MNEKILKRNRPEDEPPVFSASSSISMTASVQCLLPDRLDICPFTSQISKRILQFFPHFQPFLLFCMRPFLPRMLTEYGMIRLI